MYNKRIFTYIFTIFTFLALLIFSNRALARDTITDWYIKDFQSEITVNTDSSLDITENITADCGDLPNKHGIFRVLSTQSQLTDSSIIKSPISLISITDFNNVPLKYSASTDRGNHTISWKIGDPNKTVTGINNYQIKYHVKNAVLHQSADFDEFYWNLNGNFWDIETDNFSATITFPTEITQENSSLNVYTGSFGTKDAFPATAKFENGHQVIASYDKTMSPGEGITLSVTFPKNIIAPYVPTFLEKYGFYFFLLIPILILGLCITLWRKYGRDPKINPTIAPEFEIPEKLAPIEMGLVYSDGILKNQYLSASIINLAVNKLIKIEKTEKGKVFKSEDYLLTRLKGKYQPSKSENELLDSLLGTAKTVKISDLKNEFYKDIPSITNAGKDFLVGKKWLVASSRTWQYTFFFFGVAFVVLGGVSASFDLYLMFSFFASAIIIFIFSFFMTRRTLEGAELLLRIKGFELYMNTAEKYRQRFNEKENYFEKFLPYAIMFGMTKEWIKKMKDIYGEKYFANYHPVWFYGAMLSDFNVDSFTSELSSMTSNMASTITSSPSSSGSGGGGFSGGGGGGGGGGGW